MSIFKSILIVLIAALITLYQMLSPGPFSGTIAAICMLCLIISFIAYMRGQKKNLGENMWATPSLLLLLGLFIVYYQWYIDYLVGFKSASAFYDFGLINHYVLISTVGILAFALGYFSIKHYKTTSAGKKRLIIANSGIHLVAMEVILFVMFLYNINVSDFLSGADYSGTHGVGVFTYIEYFLQAVITAIFINFITQPSRGNQSSIRLFISSIPLICWITTGAYLFLRLFSGDRGPVITVVLIVFFSYLYYSRRKIKLVFLLLFLSAGAIGISLIGMARNYDLAASFSQRMSEAADVFGKSGRFEGKTISPATDELAFSYLSYEVMVSGMVSDNDGYKSGMYQFVALANTIPFVNGFIHNGLGFTRDQTSSSYYATYKYVGINPSWGVGTNCIGDFFMDFGIWGVLFGMLLVGIAFSHIDRILLSYNKNDVSYAMLSFAIVYASKSIYIPRSNFMAEFKLFVFVMVLLWFNSLLESRKDIIKRN